MFDNFTTRALSVMALANQEAQILNHEYIGTEHVLLGVLKENSGVGVTLLNQLGIDLKVARTAIERLVKAGPDMVTMGKLPYTPRTKSVFRLSEEFARGIDDKHVGTEHLVYGLLAETEGIACQVLRDFKITREPYVDVLMETLGKVCEEETRLSCLSCLSFDVCVIVKSIKEMTVEIKNIIAISSDTFVDNFSKKTYEIASETCQHYIGKEEK
jgi:ATP-dependent Clp protease ATP-binding subunit ClpC